ncbi:MAG: AIR synthase-related protein, partial [Phycisphaerae bacterium]|nr:AIR synthase-related protein [Phycisphaerae bacterium]
GLFNAITDCGAGGLSSAVGEMGSEIGATVDLEKVPLKYAGLRYDEIWISESQERMVLAVPPAQVQNLLALAASEDVEAAVIGTFGTDRADLVLRFQNTEVGRLSMKFLHEGIPMPRRRAIVPSPGSTKPAEHLAAPEFIPSGSAQELSLSSSLLSALSHPNVASKHWIIRQYDHEVQAGSVIKPLVGPHQRGPGDAAVIRPKLGSFRGVVISCGLAPHIENPYEMAIASIDEAVRNAVCVGGNPRRLALLDNFCWPSVEDERTLGALVRACEACHDAAKAYGLPFISGKDSLNNQFTDTATGTVIRIPNTLLISAIGTLEDVRNCITMDLKSAGNSLWLVRPRSTELPYLALVHRIVSAAIARGLIRACHDSSEGGVLVAAAEMCIGSGLGLAWVDQHPRDPAWWFASRLGEYLLELPKDRFAEARAGLSADGIELIALGEVIPEPRLVVTAHERVSIDEPVDRLAEAWLSPLDW